MYIIHIIPLPYPSPTTQLRELLDPRSQSPHPESTLPEHTVTRNHHFWLPLGSCGQAGHHSGWLGCCLSRPECHWETQNWFVDVILILSEALVCFRASGDNFLRSITRAIVNKNDGKRKIDLVDLILRISGALVCFRASKTNFLRSFFWFFCASFEAFRNSRLFSCLQG